MDRVKALQLLRSALAEVTVDGGGAATDRFSGLREVDAKVREVRMVLDGVDGIPTSLLGNMAADADFQANSRRIRLEALAGYIRSAVKFIDTGAFDRPAKAVISPPDFELVARCVPGLHEELDRRWLEAQRCIHAEAFTAAVILMGSILEGLILARAQTSISHACKAARAPRDKSGRPVPIHDWSLSVLIDVAVELGWLKTDRGKFSHALRESRNVVHPWQAVISRTAFDQATCVTTWHVLNASAEDVLASLQ